MSVGVNLGANAGYGGVGVGGSVSWDQNESLTKTKTITVDTSHVFVCPPYHNCHLVVWTWNVAINGKCSAEPDVDSYPFRDRSWCRSREIDHWFRRKWCRKNFFTLVVPRPVPDNLCVFKSPVFENGAPLSRFKWVEKPVRPQVVGWESRHVAILDTEIRWCPENGRFYTQEKGWHLLPKVPTPSISDEMDKVRPQEEQVGQDEIEEDDLSEGKPPNL
jgi:hypothetical protein